MKVEQIYELTNEITKEVLGKEGLVSEDLSNLVSVGDEVFNANAMDNYVRALVDKVGKIVFKMDKFESLGPNIMMESWEWGAVKQKVRTQIPEAESNEAWELEDGAVYEQDLFTKPEVSVKFFNDRVTFEVPMSYTDEQVKSAFTSADQMNGFISMIETSIENTLTLKIEGLTTRTINNMIAETLVDEGMETTTKAKTKSSNKVINLLYLYNKEMGTTLTVDKAILDKEFLRYASRAIKTWTKRMCKATTRFNIGKMPNQTKPSRLHLVLLEDFASGAEAYLESDTFHNDFVKLPKAETVTYWQGEGINYSFNEISGIKVKTTGNHTVEFSGILGIAFDHDACGITNPNRHTTTHRNNKAEFTNYWYKYMAGYFNDFNENFIVFVVA